jgi:hypothetical protein
MKKRDGYKWTRGTNPGLFSVNCPLYQKFQIFNEYVQFLKKLYDIRRVWRYQWGNQNPYIEEQTTQWPKEKVQKDRLV